MVDIPLAQYEKLCDHAEDLVVSVTGPLVRGCHALSPTFLTQEQLPLYRHAHDELYALATEGAPHIELTTNDTVLLDGKEKDSEALSSQEREWVNRYIKLLISLTGV